MKDDAQIDDLIKEALSKEEAEYYDRLTDKNMLQEFGGLFTGKHGWLVILTSTFIFVFMGVGIYAGIKFSQATDTKELLTWALFLIFSISSISILKVWSWMQMDKNELIREVKRLELQVATLSNRLLKKP